MKNISQPGDLMGPFLPNVKRQMWQLSPVNSCCCQREYLLVRKKIHGHILLQQCHGISHSLCIKSLVWKIEEKNALHPRPKNLCFEMILRKLTQRPLSLKAQAGNTALKNIEICHLLLGITMSSLL